jgi:hypothetical protein
MRHAIVIQTPGGSGGIVENVILWDGSLSTWQPEAGTTTVPLLDGQACDIGWTWDGETFSEPIP